MLFAILLLSAHKVCLAKVITRLLMLIEDRKGMYLFCGYTALCMHVYLKHVGMDDIVQQLYGKKELTEDETEDLLKIRFS